MGWALSGAVGLTNEGTQAQNRATDQQQVAELLDAVGLPAGGLPIDALPPIGDGFASPELCDGIRGFQQVQGLVTDARVDVNGATWQRLMAIVHPGGEPPGGVPLLLTASTFDVTELPRSASGLPSLVYTMRGPVATFVGPGIRIDLSVNGPIKVSWDDTFPLACDLAPDLAALQAALASGAARVVGGVVLDTLCSRLKAESRAAIGSMFAAVSLRVGLDGTPLIAGSIGDEDSFQSIAFDPVERAVIYTATKHIFKHHPVTGGDVQLTGDIQLELKVTSAVTEEEASLVAALVAALAFGLVLFPVAQWAAGSEVAAGVGQGVKELLLRLGPALNP
ncbi:MAG TPA: hypothetical protein VGP26_05860 [Actinophytocola sp.]|jgi:hypothetical protein|nr:hypothetical protein [Actinophytocola sp.]